jgi:hypothetical protein
MGGFQPFSHVSKVVLIFRKITNFPIDLKGALNCTLKSISKKWNATRQADMEETVLIKGEWR